MMFACICSDCEVTLELVMAMNIEGSQVKRRGSDIGFVWQLQVNECVKWRRNCLKLSFERKNE